METNDALTLTLDGHRMDAAIFAVEHKPSGRRLICSTKCLSKRLWDQQQYLQRRDHYNPDLQADLIADGRDAFHFVVLELIAEPSSLPARKRLHVDETRRSALCYNPAEPTCRQRVVISTNESRKDSTTDANPNAPLNEAMERLKQLNLGVCTPEEMTAHLHRIIETNWPHDGSTDEHS